MWVDTKLFVLSVVWMGFESISWWFVMLNRYSIHQTEFGWLVSLIEMCDTQSDTHTSEHNDLLWKTVGNMVQPYQIKSYSCSVRRATAIISANCIFAIPIQSASAVWETTFVCLFSFSFVRLFSVMFAIGALEQHGNAINSFKRKHFPNVSLSFIPLEKRRKRNLVFFLWKPYGSVGLGAIRVNTSLGTWFNSNIKWAVVAHIKHEYTLRLLPFFSSRRMRNTERMETISQMVSGIGSLFCEPIENKMSDCVKDWIRNEKATRRMTQNVICVSYRILHGENCKCFSVLI